jgi:hypothetical protein
MGDKYPNESRPLYEFRNCFPATACAHHCLIVVKPLCRGSFHSCFKGRRYPAGFTLNQRGTGGGMELADHGDYESSTNGSHGCNWFCSIGRFGRQTGTNNV